MLSSLIVAMGISAMATGQAPRPYHAAHAPARMVTRTVQVTESFSEPSAVPPTPAGDYEPPTPAGDYEPPTPAGDYEPPMAHGCSAGVPCDCSDGCHNGRCHGRKGCILCGGCGFCDDGLPCSCRGTCNLFPHTPYYVEPKTYYYFRPYNHNHVWIHREQATRFGGDPRHPYANELFETIYAEEVNADPAAPIAPPAPQRPPMSRTRPAAQRHDLVSVQAKMTPTIAKQPPAVAEPSEEELDAAQAATESSASSDEAEAIAAEAEQPIHTVRQASQSTVVEQASGDEESDSLDARLIDFFDQATQTGNVQQLK